MKEKGLFDLTSIEGAGAAQLVILVGLQGCGKTTFFNTHLSSSHVHVSKDDFRNAKNPNRRQTQLVEAALAGARSVAVDNTNPASADRAPLIDMGRRHGAEIVGYYFQSRMDECLRRNLLREGRQRVPDVALYSTLKKLQRPAYAEGFDRLFYVRTCEPCGFEIEQWIEDGEDQHEQR